MKDEKLKIRVKGGGGENDVKEKIIREGKEGR